MRDSSMSAEAFALRSAAMAALETSTSTKRAALVSEMSSIVDWDRVLSSESYPWGTEEWDDCSCARVLPILDRAGYAATKFGGYWNNARPVDDFHDLRKSAAAWHGAVDAARDAIGRAKGRDDG